MQGNPTAEAAASIELKGAANDSSQSAAIIVSEGAAVDSGRSNGVVTAMTNTTKIAQRGRQLRH